MADSTKISWTDATWNPIVGCTIVSPGCTNCYAMRDAARIIRCSEGAGRPSHYEGTIQPSKAGPVWTGKVARAPDHILTQPLRWRRPRRIFVNSMGDLFHESVPDEWIDRVFAVMALAPQHTFQILTKRARRMREYMSGRDFGGLPLLGRLPLERIHLDAVDRMGNDSFYAAARRAGNVYSLYCSVPWPLQNVWLGVTAEDQQRADERIPDLLMTPAALRWVSVEPMLGEVDLRRFAVDLTGDGVSSHTPSIVNALTGGLISGGIGICLNIPIIRTGGYPRLDWVVCGGESGPHARPMHPDWARSLRDQCKAAGAPFHFKQWGEWLPCGQHLPDIGKVTGGTAVRGGRFRLHVGGHNPHVTFAEHGVEVGALNDDLLTFRVGKARAGHLLDGVEHREFPEV